MGSACTSSSQSQTQLPDWLAGPAAETITRSVDQSKQPYQAYGGELVAGINPTQQQGIDVVRGSQGNWAGQFGDAQTYLSDAANTPGALESGQRYIDKGVMTSSADAANPLIAAGTGAGGLSTAQPFLAAASQTAPSAIASYMSPYTSSVVDEIGRLGSRNLTENIIPKISDTFIGSGQFGSDRNAKTIGNAIRDTSADIAGKQASALEAGYGQAGQLFTSDANRAASLAGTAGNLGESAASRSLTGANITANATNADANRWLAGGQAVAGMSSADQAAALAASKQAAALSGQQQQQNLSDANALLAAGGTQQQTQQAQDTAKLKQFTEGRDWNQNQLSWLNSIIRGTPSGQTTTQTQQPSLWSILGFKDGGHVPHLAIGGQPLWYDDEDEDDDYAISAGGGDDARRSWMKSANAFMKPKRGTGLLGRALSAAKFLPGLADGGIVDEDEDDPLLPADDESEEMDGGGDESLGLYDPENPQFQQMAQLSASPLAADVRKAGSTADVTMGGAAPTALSLLRERALKRAMDEPDLKAAMEGVDAAQKAALEPRKREETWTDNPLLIATAGFLGAPKGTGVLGRIGSGALEAVKNRQTERRQDQTEDQARRMDALKVAQQRLSSILSARTSDTSALTGLARAEAMAPRGAAPKTTTAMAEAAAMGFDLATDDGRKKYQAWKVGQTRAPQGHEYAPTDIEKWGRIIKDPNADPILKEAAMRALGAKGNKDMTPAQTTQLRRSAAALAQADLTGLGKDFQFKTPEERQAYLDKQTDKHLAWLSQGADPAAAPAAVPAPAAAAPAPAPAAPPAAAAAPAPDGSPAPPPSPETIVPPPAPPKPAAPIASPTPRADKMRDVPGNMVTAMSTNAQGIRQIDKALTALEEYPDGVGVKAGALNMLPGPALDAADPKGTKLRALIADIGSLKLHDRSGAAVTAAEFPRLKPFIPNVYDSPETIKSKLANFRSVYMEVLADQYAAYGPETGHKANARMEEVLKSTKGSDGEKPSPQARAATILKSGKRPEGVGTDWALKFHKPSGLNVWASPDGRTAIPAE